MERSSGSASPLSSPNLIPERSASILENGILSGVMGAAVVAVWFFILDTARGRMLLPIAAGKRGISRSKLGPGGLGKRLCRVCPRGPSRAPLSHGQIDNRLDILHVRAPFSLRHHHLIIIFLVRGNPLYVRCGHFSKPHGSLRISGRGIRQSVCRHRHVLVPDSTAPDGHNATPACLARRLRTSRRVRIPCDTLHGIRTTFNRDFGGRRRRR
jgi:hypothetical protein